MKKRLAKLLRRWANQIDPKGKPGPKPRRKTAQLSFDAAEQSL